MLKIFAILFLLLPEAGILASDYKKTTTVLSSTETMNADTEDLFEFVDLKSSYCGYENHPLKIKARKNITEEIILTIYLIPENSQTQPVLVRYLVYKGTTMEFQFSAPEYMPTAFFSGRVKIIISDSKGLYRSESKPFQLVVSKISARSTSHCEGYKSTLELIRYLSYESVAWYKDDKIIPGENKMSLEASETGKYQASIQFKGCSSKSQVIYITKGVIPSPQIDYIFENTVCKSNAASIYYESGYPYTAYEWTLNGEVISNSDKSIFKAGKPGAYTLTAYQGKCKVTSNSLNIAQNTTMFNTIGFEMSDSLISDNRIVICKGLKVSMRRRAMQSRSSFILPKNLPSDSLLSADPDILYQWKKDGIDIPGANRPGFTADQAGEYWLQIKNGDCISNSNPLIVVVSETIPAKLKYYRNDNCQNDGTAIYLIPSPNTEAFPYSTKILFKDGKEIERFKEEKNTYVNKTGNYHFIIKLNNSCEIVTDTISLNFHDTSPLLPVDTVYTCTGSYELSNPLAYFLEKQEWTFNGQKLEASGYTFRASEEGLYTVQPVSRCSPVSRFFVVKNKMKIKLDLYGESTESCEGRTTFLRAYALPYNNFRLPTSGDYSFPKIKLYRNKIPVEEKASTYIFSFDYNYFSAAAAAEFLISETGTYHVGVDNPDCEVISNSLMINFREVKSELSPAIYDPDLCYYKGKTTYTILGKEDRQFQWYKDGKPIANATQSAWDIYKPGIFYVKVEEGQCVSLSRSIAISPDRTAPTAFISGDTLTRPGSPVNLRIQFTGKPPFTYAMNNGDEGISQSNAIMHKINFEEPFVYKVSAVSNACGEGFTEGSASISIAPLANEPSIGQYIKLYPVPSTEELTIETETSSLRLFSYSIITPDGKIMTDETPVIKSKQQIDLRNIPPGVYFIRIKTADSTVTRKIIKW